MTIEYGQIVPAAHRVYRRASFRTRLRQDQSSCIEFHRRQQIFTAHLAITLDPLKSSGNHQMNHEKQFTFEFDDDLLPHPAHSPHGLSGEGFDRRIYRTQNKSARHLHSFQSLSRDTALQCLHVQGDVG